MLIKRKQTMTSKMTSVKKTGLSMALAIGLSAAFVAPAAQAGESMLFDQVVTVKFSAAQLKTETGVSDVYAKLTKRAKSFCRADSHSLQYLAQSKKSCEADLVNQFVESAGMESLKAHHQSALRAVSAQ